MTSQFFLIHYAIKYCIVQYNSDYIKIYQDGLTFEKLTGEFLEPFWTHVF